MPPCPVICFAKPTVQKTTYHRLDNLKTSDDVEVFDGHAGVHPSSLGGEEEE